MRKTGRIFTFFAFLLFFQALILEKGWAEEKKMEKKEAKKENVSPHLPPPPPGFQPGRGRFTPPFRNGRTNVRGRRGRTPHFLSRFTPEEQAELHKLSMAGDRAKFSKKFRELCRKYASAEDKKVYLLEEKYHAAKTSAEKDLIRKELKEAVLRQLEKRNNFTLRQIAEAERKLKRLKSFHARNVKNADKIAENILQYLCTPEGQRKKFHFRKGFKAEGKPPVPPPAPPAVPAPPAPGK